MRQTRDKEVDALGWGKEAEVPSQEQEGKCTRLRTRIWAGRAMDK